MSRIASLARAAYAALSSFHQSLIELFDTPLDWLNPAQTCALYCMHPLEPRLAPSPSVYFDLLPNLTLPFAINLSGGSDWWIDWGDGNSEYRGNGPLEHQYSDPSQAYDVTIMEESFCFVFQAN